MQKAEIATHAQLMQYILQLKITKTTQEQVVRNAFKEVVATLNPLTMAKQTLHNLAADKEVRFNVATVGLNMGSNFIIDQVLGKHRSIKGFLSSVLVETFASTLISFNSSKIITVIGKLLQRKPNLTVLNK